MPELDVYRDWLGIKEAARPLDFYQLLRLERFEDNVDRIRRHYRKLNAHARKYSTGKYAELSQQVLNELARAMLCLTDAARKADYDTSLGRQTAASGRRSGFEDLLVQQRALTRENLEKALKFASATGMSVRDAVFQQKLATPEVVMQVYAESLGLPYLDLAD
ncbi:MAG: general secretion pathway protein GspE, partial [Planctomycetes bacterium]|nr:general secretion pathway protein GspE [Planctomycetota bacterium]